MTQHDQSIGGEGAQDGIKGSRPGTEGATSGQGVDKGELQRDRSRQHQGHGGLGGNSTDQRQSSSQGVMETEPREHRQERKPGP